MHYAYTLKSNLNPNRYHVGHTNNLKRRLSEHNSGQSTYTSHYNPWIIINYFVFYSKLKASAFEIYLKSHAGRKFQKKHFAD